MKRFLTTVFALTLFSTVGVFGGTSCKTNKQQYPLGNILTINGVSLNTLWERYCNSNNVQAPTESTTESTTEKPVEKPTETTTESTTESTTEKPVEKPTETTTEKSTETTTERPTETTTERPTETTTERPTESTTTAPSQNTGNSSNTSLSAIEQEVVRLVNVERAKVGLAPLQIDEEVSKVARLKSEDMANKNYFDHTSPTYGTPFQMLKQFNISYKSAGENIAKGQKTAEAVVTAWMNSEGHRANILNASFTHIGVGYVQKGSTTYWTQMFISK